MASETTNQSINIRSRHLEFISIQQNRFAFEQMNEMRLNRYRTDIVLIVGNKRIDAHRLILEASSIYFRTMFAMDMIESRQSKCVFLCLLSF